MEKCIAIETGAGMCFSGLPTAGYYIPLFLFMVFQA
jgi:hypothetical protein